MLTRKKHLINQSAWIQDTIRNQGSCKKQRLCVTVSWPVTE